MSFHCASSDSDRIPQVSFSLVLRRKAEKRGSELLERLQLLGPLCDEEQESPLLKKDSPAALLSGTSYSLGVTSLKNLLDNQVQILSPQEKLGDLCLKDFWEEGGISAKDYS